MDWENWEGWKGQTGAEDDLTEATSLAASVIWVNVRCSFESQRLLKKYNKVFNSPLLRPAPPFSPSFSHPPSLLAGCP